MERYGIQVWDENGKSTATGVTPVLILDYFQVLPGQASGTRFYPELPAGARINFFAFPSDGGSGWGAVSRTKRIRGIRVNGNQIIIEELPNPQAGRAVLPWDMSIDSELDVVVYVEKVY
ncbi:hypothetical protein ACE60T_005568 [Salmonella enterica]|nr:hypothetical protein [Salmonella enterica]EAO7619089.1 hypothetical protein [Salmonella enterica]EAQ6819726.1 hypothetical protein [Salmonella enterica]